MKSRIQGFILFMLTFFLSVLLTTAAHTDHEYDYFSDRLGREYRDAGDVDDWIERGNATVTASPHFGDGVRLTAWASGSDETENYEFAIASAIYSFDIPQQAQYIEILVRYRGEPQKSDFEDYEEMAGRVWVRNTKRDYSRRSYDDEGKDETLYGDTFVLRAKRRSETIKIAAAGHVNEGLLELHVVADDGQQLDIEYIDISTYRRQPDVPIIHRYARDYRWHPWHRYTYLYFYDGPFYYGTDLGYYYRWSYPIYDHHYLSIRSSYRNYLHHYYRRSPRYSHRRHYRSYSNNVNVHVHTDNNIETRRRLNGWTETHEIARREYSRGRVSTTSTKTENTNIRTRVRTLIEKHRQAPVLADRVIQPSPVSRNRKRVDMAPGLDSAIKRPRDFSHSVRGSSTQSNRTTQETIRKRYPSGYTRSNTTYRTRTYDRPHLPTRQNRYSSDREGARSNAERRARLYNRSQSSTGRMSAPSSHTRSSGSSESTTTRRQSAGSNYRSSTSNRQTSPSRRTRSSTTSRDDDDDSRQDRSRNTSRTKRTRRK